MSSTITTTVGSERYAPPLDKLECVRRPEYPREPQPLRLLGYLALPYLVVKL
jgi:hypothetical protein